MNSRNTPEYPATNTTFDVSRIRRYWSAGNRRRRLIRPFVCVLLLVLSSGIAGAQCPNCGDKDEQEIEVKFKGKACKIGGFSVTLGGASGTGNGNSMIAPNYSNEATAFLIPDKTYQLTIGTGTFGSYVNFMVPEGYTLYVNGKETTTLYGTTTSLGLMNYKKDELLASLTSRLYAPYEIASTVPVPGMFKDKDCEAAGSGNGDGTWDVVLRKKCKNCHEDECGGTCELHAGSIRWSVSMGRLSDGRSAETISIREQLLSSAIYTPAALIYSAPGLTTEVEEIRNPDGSLRQVKVPKALADVVVISDTEYDLRFYAAAFIGPKVDGSYTVTGPAYLTWKIKNPDPATLVGLQISKIQNGLTETNDFNWDPATNIWTLSQGGGTRRQSSTQVVNGTTGDRTKTTIVKNNIGEVVQKSAQTFHTFAWGEALVQEVTDPDGAVLTTTYAYYENAFEDWRYGKVLSVTRPDGSWSKYDYDNQGNTILVMRPWKDLSLASATEENSDVTRYYFTNTDGISVFGFARIVTLTQQTLAGTMAGLTHLSRTATTVDTQPAIREEEQIYSSIVASQLTVTTRYHSTASPFLANRIASIEMPDGRKDTYTYEHGNYSINSDPASNTFTPDVSGKAERITIVHGTTAAPDGVAFKTTKETTVSDEAGHSCLEETYVYNGTTYERMGWTVSTYNSRGQLTQTTRHTGQVSTMVWYEDRLISTIDEAGVETVYSNFDLMGKAQTSTKKGVAANTGFPAQADVVTNYTFDSLGRTLTEVMSAGGQTLTKSTSYDVAARLKTETDPAGLTKSHTYTNGGRTQTVVSPGGTATQITDRYLDGETKSVTGTSVVTMTYDHDVNTEDGTRYTKSFMGSDGVSSPRWTKTTADWLRRDVKVERPTFNPGITLTRSSVYNIKGQLQSESVATGVSKLTADKFYEYDELGNRIRLGQDVDASGVLANASSDRINESGLFYEKNGSDWFRISTAKTYLVSGNSTAVTTQIERERLNNFITNGTEKTISEVTTTDVAGNQTKTTSTIDRAAKKATVTTDTPDSITNHVEISVNRLLQSSTLTTPQAATAYSYDALGRLIETIDPRNGTATKTFDSATGQLRSDSHSGNSSTYDYYPSTNASAGNLKTQTNAAGKKTYFNYNSRGELVQRWGDTSYPLEYVFDAYGQRTELHTFRGGSGWTSSTWPTATTGTADVTRSIYQSATGLLLQKQDAASKQTAYTYDALGRILTRTWARPGSVSTTYTYDKRTEEMSVVDYSDTTPDISFVYDRGGRPIRINDAAGARTLSYDSAGGLLVDQISGGILDGVSVTMGYDSYLRRNSFQSSRNATTLSSQTYAYDNSSRTSSVTSGAQTATYAYYPSSGLLNTTTFTGGTSITRVYDNLGRVQSITNAPAGGGATSYSYTYNNLSQRTRLTREDNSYWAYLYDDYGELTSGKKYWADTTVVAGQQTEYAYDNIGNRSTTKAGGDAGGANLRLATYTPNSLNQYTQRTVPGALDVIGTANSTATVTVNNNSTYRKDGYFHKALTLDNSAAPLYPQISVVGAKNSAGPNGEDAIAQQSGNAYVAKSVEAYSYDEDGNLTSDGRWTYAWNAENRLISMTAIVSAPVAAKRRLEFAYDSSGKRIQKKVYQWNVPTSSYQLQSATKFIYDGWNLSAEVDASGALVRSYTWGQDNSSTLEGAGGIGGLLSIKESGSSYQAGYDGNGNVTVVVNAGNGLVAASYDYDGFGNTLKAAGEYAQRNPFRFSTKYTDAETNFVYFGFRYYEPQSGRWLGRDPSQEEGGLNLYAYVQNNPIGFTDPFGLWETKAHDLILREAFKKCLSEAQIKKLQAASYYVDDITKGGQNEYYSFQHGMRAGNNQSEMTASNAAFNFIELHQQLARGLASGGCEGGCKKIPLAAIYELGQSLHTIMDMTSPAHIGFQVWNGPPYPTGIPPFDIYQYTKWYNEVLKPHAAKETVQKLVEDGERFRFTKDAVKAAFANTFGDCCCSE